MLVDEIPNKCRISVFLSWLSGMVHTDLLVHNSKYQTTCLGLGWGVGRKISNLCLTLFGQYVETMFNEKKEQDEFKQTNSEEYNNTKRLKGGNNDARWGRSRRRRP